jgi:hypothetical protein
MSLKIIAATFLLVLPAASAQALLPKLRVEPTTGGSIFYVQNVSTQPLTAYVIELVDYPGSFFAFWQDDVTSQAIAPDKEKRIPVANMTVGAVPDYVKMQAAIYADGTTAGVPEKVAQLVARRRFLLETVRDLIQRLSTAREAKTPKETASASLRDASKSMVLPAKADKSSQNAINLAAGRMLFLEAADFLDQHSLEQTIARLQEWEKAIAESKPAL